MGTKKENGMWCSECKKNTKNEVLNRAVFCAECHNTKQFDKIVKDPESRKRDVTGLYKPVNSGEKPVEVDA